MIDQIFVKQICLSNFVRSELNIWPRFNLKGVPKYFPKNHKISEKNTKILKDGKNHEN